MRVPIRLFTLGVVCLAVTAKATAQDFAILAKEIRAFPNIRALVYSFNQNGQPLVLNTSALTVRENGTIVSHIANGIGDSTGRNVSMMFVMDASSSTRTGTTFPQDMQKTAIKATERLFDKPLDEVGLITYDNRATLVYGLTSTRPQFASVVDGIAAGTGDNIPDALAGSPYGAFSQLQNASNSRALILFTDGAPSLPISSLITTARAFRIAVYVVGLNTSLSDEVKLLADTTGGLWVENITTSADATVYTRAFAAHAKGLRYTEVEWTSNLKCATTVGIDLSTSSSSRTDTYTVPSTARTLLTASVTSLDFGEVQAGETRELSVMITARNGDCSLGSITIPNSRFTIVEGAISGPDTLSANESRTIRIRFTPLDSSINVSTLTIESEACDQEVVYMRGGFRARDRALRITSPNGGEQLQAGLPTTITWEGALPSDIVRVDVSTDAGTSWAPVSETADGLEATWIPGPATTIRGRIRLQRTAIDPSKIVSTVPQRDPLYAADFTRDGRHVVTGGDDRSVRLYDARTGEQVRIIGTHGDWVWAVACHPSRPLVATGSHDGSVRIWNYETATRVALIPASDRIWSVAFTADGSTLFVGSDSEVMRVNTETWAVERTRQIPAGSGSVPNVIYSISVSSDGSRIVTAEGSRVVVRNATTLDSLAGFSGHEGPVYAVAFSPDGSRIASGGADRIIRTWNTTSAQVVNVTPLATGSILSLQYATNGQFLIAGGGDATAKIYSPNLTLQNSLAGHAGLVYSARLDRTNGFIVTASTDYTARIWDIAGLRTIEDVSDADFAIVGGTAAPLDRTFGDVAVGTGVDRKFTIIENTGNSPVVVRAIRIASGNVSEFGIATPSTPVTIPANGSIEVIASFTPTATGQRSVAVEFETGSGTIRSNLTGNGVAPRLLVTPTVYDFGRKLANQQEEDLTVNIENPAGASAPVTVNSVTIAGPQSTMYSVTSGGGSFTLSPGQRRPVVVRFTPTDLGRFPGVIVIDDAGATIDPTVRIYGEGAGDSRIEAPVSLIFESEPCSSKAIIQTVQVSNRGTATLRLFAVGVEGADAGEFTVSGANNFPLDVAAGSTTSFSATFRPRTAGPKSARLVITSNALNATAGRTTVPIIARKDSLSIELSRSTVNFENTPEGRTATERLLLINSGTVRRQWPRGPINLGAFVIESITPDITQPGEQSEVTVTFKGGTAGESYNASYVFPDSTCGRDVTLTLLASVKSYIGCTVRIDSVRTSIGNTVTVPIHIDNKVNFDRTTVTSINVQISTNGSVLVPTGDTPAGTVTSDGQRTLTVSLPIPTSGTATTPLQFRALWGTEASAILRIDSAWTNDTLLITTDDGVVILDDICREGGARLLAVGTQSASITVAPLPAAGPVTARIGVSERGRTRVEIVDLAGRTIRTPFDAPLVPGLYDVPIDTSTMENGTYFLILITPTERISQRLDIVK
ncbi:MAG TPA: hypothetical protein DIS79_02440 [Bacteroidetes bacterium]|nr:hypothetical protein [Bacteroidota bacterium]HRK04508.1 choice-of-anchor D domain-containing protein [Chlorobiota bacterium]